MTVLCTSISPPWRKKKICRCSPKTVVAGGNDAGAIQLTGAGCRVAAISLPCRYIHSPACALRKEDLRDTLALLRLLRDRLPAARV